MTNILPATGEAGPAERAGAAEPTNIRLGLTTLMTAMEAGDGSPRLCIFYGPSGYGKSFTLAYLAAQFEAACFEAKSITTTRSMLESIAIVFGIARPERTSTRLLDQIITALQIDPRPLLIDEMDHLVKKHLVEIIRDIHDATTVPIMMVGEESLPAKLDWERFDNRIIAATAAQPSSLADALRLRDHYCLKARPDDELVADILAANKGITRRIVVNLRAVQSAALEDGLAEVDLRWWKSLGRPYLTGDLPFRRKAA